MSEPIFHYADNADALAEQLAADVANILRSAIADKGMATLVVSGGSTPKPFFQYLSKADLAWESVWVTLADERCVEPTDEQSNARLVRENLLENRASTAQFVALFEGGEASEGAASIASSRMSELPKFDVVILGMGGDGHTASIFPKATNREAALNAEQRQAALLVDPVTVAPMRITLSANRLLSTGFIALHLTGQEKASLLAEILANPNAERWPISHFTNQSQVPMNIYSDVSIPI